MLDLQIINKINEVEKKTDAKLLTVLSKVPFMTVVTAFKEIQIPDLVDMVLSVPIPKLIHGLNIISIEEIQRVSVDKLKTVLKHGNMYTVEQLQQKFGSTVIITALSKLSNKEIEILLKEDDFELISSAIENVAYV